MSKIKQFIGILLILFSLVTLFIAILTIWEVITNEMAKEAFMKVLYTFIAIFIASLVVMFITKKKE
ncbi:MAG: hypothetical protein QY321_00480 [Patescibacteria group bacterium]|nr:MAG: hypothetical protein QY321_00480 [Patescibacteria group bacterium]